MTATTPAPGKHARFRAAYAEHRAAEGRQADSSSLVALPYLQTGPFVREWAVRARTYQAFLRHVIRDDRGLNVLDLGAGTGWLCYRLARTGHHATALDWRWDTIDGLGAAASYAAHLDRLFPRVAASFAALPLPGRRFDVAVFDAAIHYAEDVGAVLAEAARVTRPGGRIAILDTPFYRRREDGELMVAEKRRQAPRVFGDRADALLELESVEYLTPDTLAQASAATGLAWTRHRVRYPLWYELRPVVAALTGQRPPSRFDLWTATVP